MTAKGISDVLNFGLGGLVISVAVGWPGDARSQSAPAQETVLEEIVVTANRREQDIQDVALSVTALTNQRLQEMGADVIQDYYRVIPNFAVVDRGPGGRLYSIRGISAGIVQQGTGTVGVYIDEMPVSANYFQPDLSVYDLERVEILRGPQGTLFGEGSLGGTVRMITPDPDNGQVQADVSADYSETDGGGGNSALNGMLNLPLGESAALRVTGYYRDYSGYIDRVADADGVQLDVGALIGFPGAFQPVLDTGPIPAREDINDEETLGGRVSFLWNATDALSFKLSYLAQNSEFGARNTQIGSLGNYQTNFYLAEEVEDDLDLLNLTVEWDLGWATLLSSTSTFDRSRTQLADNADLGGQVFPGLLLAGVGTLTEDYQDQVSEDIRLVSDDDGALSWTAGLFYVDKKDGYEQIIVDEEDFFVNFANILFRDIIGSFPMPPFPLTDARQLLDHSGHFDETQFAAYGELEYRFGERWSAIAGARYYDYDKTDTIINNNINILGLGLQDGAYDSDDSGTNLKFGLNYTPTDNLLVYATASEGFRIGGTNTAPGIPEENVSYGPDSLWNYELGVKSDLAGGALQVNAAAFYVDWTDIQLALPLGFSFGTINAGEAQVVGGELELLARPSERWDLAFALGYNDGELTADAPGADDPGNPNPGFDGDRLPGTPDLNAAASAQYMFPVSSWNGFLRADWTYTGDSTTTFNESSFNGNGDSSYFELDSYNLLNLRAGIRSNHWTTTLYVDNVTNETAEILTDNASIALRVTRNRPRTVGIKFQYDY